MAEDKDKEYVKELKKGKFGFSVSSDGGSDRLSKLYTTLSYGYIPSEERIRWRVNNVNELEGRATGENIYNVAIKKWVEVSFTSNSFLLIFYCYNFTWFCQFVCYVIMNNIFKYFIFS